MDNEQISNQEPSMPVAHHRQRRATIMVVILFALIVVGMFIFTFLKQNELQDSEVQPVANEEIDNYAAVTRINGKHFFSDGEHTVVGELALPTPCDLLEVNALVAESFPEQITLDFRVVNNSENCIQTITTQRFKVSATASEEAVFSALFQNRAVELNLTPAAPGETPEDFELFIKG